MTDFESIDALLAAGQEVTPLPPAEERRALREALGLSRTQVAGALGVSPSTVGGWESGREPSGEVRAKYAYFLDGAARKARSGRPDPAPAAAAPPSPEPAPEPVAPPVVAPPVVAATGAEDVEELAAPQPCVLCGAPVAQQVSGYPQHLDPTACGATPAAPVDPTPPGARTPRPAPTRPTARPPKHPDRPGRAERPDRRAKAGGAVRVTPVGRRVQTADATPDLIGRAVAAALDEYAGDVDAATAALVRRAIPDAMALLDATRKGGRYDIVAHPWLPDVLRKQTARGPDQIWEARPRWVRGELPAGRHRVTALDVNGAYLSALKTHLPIGQLEHSTDPHHNPRRAGVHLVTPPHWEHEAILPNPIGSRDEPGPLWVTEPTLRLLLRLSGPRYGLCDPPEIHESFTSGATENLLEKFRTALKDARDDALAQDDDVTLEYVKAMYSKFVSTLGESHYNREIYRTDWMHLIRSQAFANLWWKAYKAHDEGLLVVRAMGTDELHVTGEWRHVFPEGRGVTEVKVKDVYDIGTDPADDPAEEAD